MQMGYGAGVKRVGARGRVLDRAGLAFGLCLLVGMGVPRVRVRAAETSPLAGNLNRGFAADVQQSGSARDLVQHMIGVEDAEQQHKGHYMYLSQERSDRTGEHLWTERVVETGAGKVRRLIAEDGQPLAGERAAAENTRLAEIAADPEGFRRRSEGSKNDEQHAKQMLELLPRAFVFEAMRQEGEFVRIDYKPNPDYTPQSIEERVLHGMMGTLLVDPKTGRLHRLEGRLAEDVNIGFGLLGTVKAGSNFSTTREPVPGNEWKTAMMDTDINGRVIFFKTIGKKQHAEHSEFELVPADITVVQAVALLEG